MPRYSSTTTPTTIFTCFNSFPAAVFRKMLNYILCSIARKPWKVYSIYLNPVCRELLTETGVFRLLFRRGLLPREVVSPMTANQ